MSSVELIRQWDLDWESCYISRSKKSGNIYITYINLDDGFADCDCPAFLYSPKEARSCKHVRDLIVQFPPKREMVFNMAEIRSRFLSSSLMGVNTLIGGYLRGVPYGLYGPAATGKSKMAIQDAYALAKQMTEKQNQDATNNRIGEPVGILYYDTEGDGDILQALSEDSLVARFGPQKWVYMSTATEIPKNIDRKKNDEQKLIIKVCKDWGFDAAVRKEIGKDGEFKGKVRFEWLGDVTSEVEQKIRQENIGVVIIDSISEPLDGFPGGRMNFPARADAIKLWMSQVHLLAKRYGLVVLTIHHSSKDPTTIYARENMLGGNVLFYRYKVVMCLERVGEERKLRLARHFNKKEWAEEVRLMLGDDGFVDSETPKTRIGPKSLFKEQ